MEQKVNEVRGLYLKLDLQSVAQKLGRPLVISNYVCDLNDVIAKKDKGGEFQVAHELKNASDWRLFQELTAQSDVIITGAGYLKRYASSGEKAENVIDQFSKGGEFASLGDWREGHNLKRNPDIVVVSRSLDFEIPAAAFKDNRKVIIFTTTDGAFSQKAADYQKIGAEVVSAGKVGVDGKVMIRNLSRRGYKVIKMTTGPRVLDILLKANVMDEIFITRVQREIKGKPADVQTVLGEKKLENLQGFKYKRLFYQDEVIAHDGHMISQDFGVYKKTG